MVFFLTTGAGTDILKRMDGWQSGLMRRSWNRSDSEDERGFKEAEDKPVFERSSKGNGFLLDNRSGNRYIEEDGWVAEWFNAAVLKTVEGRPSGSSNLSPSAKKSVRKDAFF